MRVLLTAFEPYGEWSANASLLALDEFLRDAPASCNLVVRRYPVDFAAAPALLERDLADDFSLAVHLGQAPGSSAVRLEACAINLGRQPNEPPDVYHPLVPDGPAAYLSPLPLARLADAIRQQGIPAGVSFHAGTYLCNAIYYWSLHLAHSKNLPTQALFVHLPLETSQAARQRHDLPSLPAVAAAAAIRYIVTEMMRNP